MLLAVRLDYLTNLYGDAPTITRQLPQAFWFNSLHSHTAPITKLGRTGRKA